MGVVFIDWWKAVALPGFSVKIQAMPGSDGDIQNWSQDQNLIRQWDRQMETRQLEGEVYRRADVSG